MRLGSLLVVSDEKFDFDRNIFVLWMYNTINNANFSLKPDMKAKVGDTMMVVKLTLSSLDSNRILLDSNVIRETVPRGGRVSIIVPKLGELRSHHRKRVGLYDVANGMQRSSLHPNDYFIVLRELPGRYLVLTRREIFRITKAIASASTILCDGVG